MFFLYSSPPSYSGVRFSSSLRLPSLLIPGVMAMYLLPVADASWKAQGEKKKTKSTTVYAVACVCEQFFSLVNVYLCSSFFTECLLSLSFVLRFTLLSSAVLLTVKSSQPCVCVCVFRFLSSFNPRSPVIFGGGAVGFHFSSHSFSPPTQSFGHVQAQGNQQLKETYWQKEIDKAYTLQETEGGARNSLSPCYRFPEKQVCRTLTCVPPSKNFFFKKVCSR
uniref:Uncharacterized protein TCIL3000_6_400 n=1 Tax=Trypanosoma congolense (strain IL3000) TaxID=1068625 RepID=G0UN54_TRYCI|nr:unnamed protein product [Trypanosoma congolense IL3000]